MSKKIKLSQGYFAIVDDEDFEADEVVRVWPEGPKTLCIVSDIDNTLANTDHREHWVNTQGKKKDWRNFFANMHNDSVNEWCKNILNTYYDFDFFHGEVLLVSARPEDYYNKTKIWLEQNSIYCDKLIMRAKGDFRKDDVVKEQLYEFEIKTHYEVLFWLDDRKQVIDKIRSHGVTVLDCAGPKGDF